VSLQGRRSRPRFQDGGSYEGKLERGWDFDQRDIHQGGAAAAEPREGDAVDEWAIPDPPPPPRVMATDAKPSFESPDKPSNPGSPGQGINVGRAVRIRSHAEYAASELVNSPMNHRQNSDRRAVVVRIGQVRHYGQA